MRRGPKDCGGVAGCLRVNDGENSATLPRLRNGFKIISAYLKISAAHGTNSVFAECLSDMVIYGLTRVDDLLLGWMIFQC